MAVEEREVLEALVTDPDFQELSSNTRGLNLFEAVGVTHYEIRHSAFLAFLLDPRETHGLGSTFLEEFLAEATRNLSDSPFTSLEMRLQDLHPVEVVTEWNHIDIFLRNPKEGWVCVIENKVRASEHGDQLERYRDTVEALFPDHAQLFIYLTPDGREASDDGYVATDYETVVQCLERARDRHRENLSTKAHSILDDYTEILRRHVMTGSEIADLCQKVYRRHKDAIDLINEHLPSPMDEVQAYAKGLIPRLCDEFDLLEDEHSRSGNILRFWPEPLERPGLRQAEDGRWTSSNRILLMEVDFRGSKVHLKMVLGPGDQTFRQRVYDWLTEQNPPFRRVEGDEPKKVWQHLYRQVILSEDELEEIYLDEGEEAMMEAFEEELRTRLHEDLPGLTEAIQRAGWYKDL